jgi:hypothetical protein
MNASEVKSFLLWCVCIDYGVLFVWFGVFVFAHDWLYRVHTRWFKLSRETFDALHYGAMAAYKIGVLLFTLVPLLALAAASR